MVRQFTDTASVSSNCLTTSIRLHGSVMVEQEFEVVSENPIEVAAEEAPEPEEREYRDDKGKKARKPRKEKEAK
jgi:hypothetical protein